MRASRPRATVVLFAGALMGCEAAMTRTTRDTPGDSGSGSGPIPTFSTPATRPCPALRPNSVLVDATHDGGVWWFPQSDTTPDGFNPDSAHQGFALVQYLRARGYAVTELGRGATLSTDSLRTYATVIRAGYFADDLHAGYSSEDLVAYNAYLDCPRTLVLLGEYLRDGRRDPLADDIGIRLTGILTGTVTNFTEHELTVGVSTLPFIAGSFLENGSDAGIQVLGLLPSGERVMGVLSKGSSKVFFIGDTNGMESMPQPLLQNLVAWGFR